MTAAPGTFMRREMEEIPAAVRRLLGESALALAAAGDMQGRAGKERRGNEELRPVIALSVRDAAEKAVGETVARVVGQGAEVLVTAETDTDAYVLPFAKSSHPLTDPLALIVSFYSFIETLARHRGVDPDAPPHLRKVTETN